MFGVAVQAKKKGPGTTQYKALQNTGNACHRLHTGATHSKGKGESC